MTGRLYAEDPDLLADFIQEAEDRLQEVETTLTAPDGGPLTERLETLERAIHTVMGSALTLGLVELGRASEHVYERLHRLRGRAATELADGDRTQLELFVKVSRDYLAQLFEDGTRRQDLMSAITALEPEELSAAESAERAVDEALFGDADDHSPMDTGVWCAQVDLILAEAPLIIPRMHLLADRCAEVLAREPEKGESGATERIEETVVRAARRARDDAGSAAEDTRSLTRRDLTGRQLQVLDRLNEQLRGRDPGSASFRLGFAFEAWCALIVLERRQSQRVQAGTDVSTPMAHAAEFLSSYHRWALEGRGVPLRDYLQAAADWGTALCESRGTRLTAEVESAEVAVLPLVGELVLGLLKTLFRAAIARETVPGAPTTIQLRVSAGADALILTVVGLPLTWSEEADWSIELRSLVGTLGGSFAPDPSGALRFGLPDGLHTLDVLVAETGNTWVGIPWHRVLRVQQDFEPADPTWRSVHWDGHVVPLLDLTGADIDYRPPVLIALRSEQEAFCVLVDGVLGRRELLAAPMAELPEGSAYDSFCIAADGKRIPLLGMWQARRAAIRQAEETVVLEADEEPHDEGAR